ncbi:MAG: glycosyltransferase [Gemmatimonadetes bacterium]|nr:glycosyltransferase [Gemmatimonadota bacterium]
MAVTPSYIAAHNGAHIYGGGEKWTILLLAALARRGHRVKLFCADDIVADRAVDCGVATERVRLRGDFMLTDAWRFGRVLRSQRPDAVLLATFRKIWLGGLACRYAGVPRVVVRVGLSTDVPRNLKYGVTLRHLADCIVLNAEEMRGPFLARAPYLDPGRVLTVYDGVDFSPASMTRDAARGSLGVPARAFVVGAVARLSRQKRFDRLLHALAELPPEVHCVLVGEGEAGEREALGALAGELQLADRVHFPGFRADVPNVLAAFDLFVVSSEREGMSNAMLEALTAGVPVVSTPVSGAREALAPLPDGRRPGIVTAGFAGGELSAAIRRVMSDATLRAEMRAAALDRPGDRFGFERMVDQWEDLLLGNG